MQWGMLYRKLQYHATFQEIGGVASTHVCLTMPHPTYRYCYPYRIYCSGGCARLAYYGDVINSTHVLGIL